MAPVLLFRLNPAGRLTLPMMLQVKDVLPPLAANVVL
jgi:hypothetical protein